MRTSGPRRRSTSSRWAARCRRRASARRSSFGGRQEILVNNIAWFLRRSPAFAVPRRPCRVQPVHVDDVARIAADAGESREPGIVDAVGPETFTYRELVQRIGAAVGSRARIVPLPERAVAALGRAAGLRRCTTRS